MIKLEFMFSSIQFRLINFCWFSLISVPVDEKEEEEDVEEEDVGEEEVEEKDIDEP